MTTRMEKIVEDIALAALRKATHPANPLSSVSSISQALPVGWQVPDSRTPMCDAISAAAKSAASSTGLNASRWETAVREAWESAVKETVGEYFEDAKRSFAKGRYSEGAETLGDAARATLGHIACVRNWPHNTQGDLYSIAVALGSSSGWPETLEEFDQALINCSEEGKQLGSALGASTGLPDSISYGTYTEDPQAAERNGFYFAQRVIELANRLAAQAPSKT